jgi:phosphoglycerate dehydrogenase-like enzyme
MKSMLYWLVLVPLLLSRAQVAWSAPATDPETLRIIEAFGLREAPEAIADHPKWRPRRVVVSLPDPFAGVMPGLEQKLRDIAGDVELHIDRSPDFSLDTEVLAGADAVIGLCSPAMMNNADDSLLWLHNYLIGVDPCLGLPEDQIRGRVFTNSKRLSGPAIAEHSIAMLLSLARGLPAFQRADGWDQSRAANMSFGEVAGKQLLVVGLGGIGSQIAWRAHGLGMRVSAVRNSSREGPDYVDYVGLPDELHDLAARADVVVNALPLTEKTRGLFDASFFKAVKRGAIFISVGRGKSTVTGDLVAALQSGHLYGAGLDVTDPEPLPDDNPLWQMDNVIITPHISAAGSGSMRRIGLIAAENLRRYLAGERLLNVVDMRAGY